MIKIQELSVAELRRMASDAGITGASTMKKADLVLAVGNGSKKKAAAAIKVKPTAKTAKAAAPAGTAKTGKTADAAKAAKPKKTAKITKSTGTADPVADVAPALAPYSVESVPERMFEQTHPGRFATVLPAIPDEDLGLLPSRYDTDCLYAFPRDPERVFAVWELSGHTRSRLAGRALTITFKFDDGHKVVDISDEINSEVDHYYCAVPGGMLNVSVVLAVRNGARTDKLMSFGPVRLAIAFERIGDAVFVDVDTSVSLAGTPSEGSPAAVRSAGVVPVTLISPDGDAAIGRVAISDMPVSRRK